MVDCFVLRIFNKINLILFVYLINSMNRKMPPVIPSATMKPFQKSDKKSLFILLGMILNIIIYFQYLGRMPLMNLHQYSQMSDNSLWLFQV